MRKTFTTLGVLAGVVFAGTACHLQGKWKRVETDPPQALFPVDTLNLGHDQQYTALWEHQGRKHGSTGTYQYKRGTLSVAESGREPRDYGARLRWDGMLELTYSINGKDVTAILQRSPELEEKQPKDPETPPKETDKP